ncbi:PepSY domain-containing protein [Roseiconus nitratireducens]|nr:PepSY domain-containing protein [Roseiconus nitratireducens]
MTTVLDVATERDPMEPSQSDQSQSDQPQSGQPTDSATPASKRKPKRKTLAGKMGRSALMLVRRVHLYSGIFMFPFVLLYGFTGWFFNHPRLFTGDRVVSFHAAELDDPTLSRLPSPRQAAEAVVEEMNFESLMAQGPVIDLKSDRSPRYTGFLTYTVRADDASHEVSINPITGDGEVRTTVIDAEEASEPERKSNPLDVVSRIDLESNALLDVQRQVPKILEQLGLSSGEAVSGRRSANLEFAAEAEGVPCLVTYDLASGRIASVREDERPELNGKSFLQRLHLARTYSPGFDVRWVWALLVDAMFVSMVFWGVSGLMMWWQVKRTRLVGGGVLLASVVFATLMAFNMHDSLTASSGGRGGHGHGGGPGGGRGGRGFGGRGNHANVEETPSIARPSVASNRRP